ncbi:MAG: hypothetical protein QOG43_2649 [Actinomycetota bacterium]|nr:hypothetical protein [Actinomycetota bacterium]
MSRVTGGPLTGGTVIGGAATGTDPAPPPLPERGGRRIGRTVTRLRAASHSTPGRYRLWSLATAGVLILAIVVSAVATSRMRSATQRARSTSGPVLVATQQLVASLAEADAAASAAFLSGQNEDPEQRRLYEQALSRSGEQVEDIASLAGDDDTIHALLSRISFQITRYAGLVEAARATNRIPAAAADANGYLVAAVGLADQVVKGDVQTLTQAAQESLRHDQDRRPSGFLIALLVLVAALVVLGAGQTTVTKVSRRILNIPLAVATGLALAALAWLALAGRSSGTAIDDARRDGYDSIVVTAQVGREGFGAKAAETLAVITGDAAHRADADAGARNLATSPVTPGVAAAIRDGNSGGAPGGLIGQAAEAADSPRERAAVAEMAARWQQYVDTVATLRQAASPAAARAIAVGPANSTFNGFNFSVQAVLGQNRDQFLAGLGSAADRTTSVPTGVLLLLVAALGAMFWGFQIRIDDYR